MMKVLVISHNPFSKTQNNGKTLEAIFNNYSKDSISQLFFSDLYPDMDYCNSYFRITDKDVIINTISHKKKFTINFPSGIEPSVKKISSSSSIKRKIQQLPFVRDLIWILGGWKYKELFRWIEKNKPDYIFFVAGQFSFSHRIACFLSDKYQLPLVVYFTDDYFINPINRNWLDKFEKLRMEKFYNKTIQKASLCYAIGSKMATVYTQYFGKEFHYIMNMVPLNEKLAIKPHEEVIISYFGGLHLNRWKQIVRLGNAIKKINRNLVYPVKLYVYSKPLPEEIELSFRGSNVEYKGFISGERIIDEFSKSDILLHVESDDTYYKSLTKLSVSTKIPEYISTGRCVLGFGPEDVASMELLNERQIGFIISSSLCDHEINEKLEKFIRDKSLQQHLSETAYEFALDNFDPTKIRQKFNNQITNMLKYWKHVDI